MISELLRKEAWALDFDASNPSPAWCFDYWKAHYSEFGSDVEAYEENLSEEEQDYFYDLSYELSEDEADARAYLDAMSDEEQFEYAKFQFSGFMTLFGRKNDYYGYEGCSCFMDNGNGEYTILVDMNEERVLLNDTVYIEKNSFSKDRMMAQLRSHTYTDNDSVDVEYIRLKRTDEQGKKHRMYVGYIPVIYDGEIKAVFTLNYNYDLFVKKIDNNGDDNHLLIVPILLSLLRPVNQTALLLRCVTRIKDLVSPFVFLAILR